jgi:molybdopterin-containing oxidoreductase family membrane subunit
VISAAAVGPAFIILTTRLVEAITRKRLVKPDVYQLLGRVSGWMLVVYVLLKAVDTLIWVNATSPRAGFSAYNYYLQPSFGSWILFAEVILLGLLPAILLIQRSQAGGGNLVFPAVLACAGIVLNRFVLTIQTLALPTLPFDRFLSYWPSWQETATFVGVVGYGVIVYSVSYRYLHLFPQERDLRPS